MPLKPPPFDTFVGRAVRLPLRLIPPDTVVSVRSGLNRGMKWRVGSNIHGCWLGTYEASKQAVVAGLVRPGMNVFDVGANAGFYTLAFARLCGASGHVWAFEPFAENSANLRQHIALNGLGNVSMVQAAVSEAVSVTGFRVGPENDNSMGMLASAATDYLVPTIALDWFLDAAKAPVPDLVKIDVEGAEGAVLSGARGILAHRKTTWLVALHGDEQRATCTSLLRAAGYSIEEFERDEVLAVPG